MVRWKINKTVEEKIKKLQNVTDILCNKNSIFLEYKEEAQKVFDEWIRKLESEKVFSWDSFIFRPIALALVRRTFPDLFANKVVGVQAMSTPVRLAYAKRVIYNEDGLSAKNNI